MTSTIRNRGIIPFLAFTLILIPHAIKADSDSVTEVNVVLTRLVAGYESADVEKIMALYASSDTLVVYDVTPPLRFVGYDAYKKAYEDFYAAFPGGVSVDVTEREVSVVGELAYTHEINKWTVRDQADNSLVFTARETYVLQKIDGAWLIVHEHASVPADLSTGNAVLNLKP